MRIEDRERLVRVEDAVMFIKEKLDGNGAKGLIQQVRDNTYWRYGLSGAITIIMGLISYGVIKVF